MIEYVGFGAFTRALFNKSDLDSLIYGVCSAEGMSRYYNVMEFYTPETNNSRRYRGLKPLRTNRAKLASK